MSSRTTQLPPTPPVGKFSHVNAILDIEGPHAEASIIESESAVVVDTIDSAAIAGNWAEVVTDRSRVSAGTIPVNPNTSALMCGRLGEEVSVSLPGPARREKLRQLVAYGLLALALDGAP